MGSGRGCELKVWQPREWEIKFTMKVSVRMPKYIKPHIESLVYGKQSASIVVNFHIDSVASIHSNFFQGQAREY
jgi:hypothetical protein